MEDWQQWQIRADEIAAALGAEVDDLSAQFFGEGSDSGLRGFWPRLRDLKERVRTAPAIRLEAKLDLERRLRVLGSRAYKAQEVAFAQSSERKVELFASIEHLRAVSETLNSPRDLRALRRDMDRIREQFDAGAPLVPVDRQAVWDTWRAANQFVWERLTGLWQENEAYLRGLLDAARENLRANAYGSARQGVAGFFETLRDRECKQDVMNALRAEADAIRREADQLEARKTAERAASQQSQVMPVAATWRSEIERNHESIERLVEEIAVLDSQYQNSRSILDQAMVRGILVDKKRKLAEYERSTKALERRLEQTEEAPVISVG